MKNALSKEKIEFFKKQLEEERDHLKEDIARVASKNPNVPGDWEPRFPVMNIDTADQSEIADSYEEFETLTAIEEKREERLMMVNRALESIKRGTYGICKKCGESIDEKRLMANPLAGYCIKHEA